MITDQELDAALTGLQGLIPCARSACSHVARCQYGTFYCVCCVLRYVGDRSNSEYACDGASLK